jgi:hypothetical protein
MPSFVDEAPPAHRDPVSSGSPMQTWEFQGRCASRPLADVLVIGETETHLRVTYGELTVIRVPCSSSNCFGATAMDGGTWGVGADGLAACTGGKCCYACDQRPVIMLDCR